ncbi:MAG: protein kinase, partial [Chloroflexi bacterium]|nr:protein kinase [Chloroflexota bacterium]
INQIGQGGMATVYKAYHAAMDRYIALKVLPSQLAQNKEFVKRFEQEARTIAKLEHAHILPVYDYGEQEGITYLVMRYLDAGTLKEKIQSGTLSLNDIDRYFSQLASALAYAHEMNVIHRDIKPSNAMVNSRGELFLTDFGIAKLLESTAQFTATGAITGTPAYMSPEQAQGDKLDARSYIYSLGIVLYEMVTGKVPFEAETPLAVILKQINAPLPPPTSLRADLDPEIEKVLLKALAKNREDRFATCDEFLHAWKSALTHTATAQVTPPSPAQKESAAPTLAAPPTSTAAPAVKESPSKKKSPSRWLIFGGIGASVFFTLCFCLFALAQISNQNQQATRLAQTSASTSAPPQVATLPNITTQGTSPAVTQSGWISWSVEFEYECCNAVAQSCCDGDLG